MAKNRTRNNIVSVLRSEERQMEIDNRNGKRIFVGRQKKYRQPVANYIRQNGLGNSLSANGASVVVPVSGGIVTRPMVPRFNMRGDSTIVTNTEILNNQTLAAAGAFNTSNSALIAAAPSWLAQVADLYSKYRWLKCTLIYVPKCPTTTSGSVVMALTYDRNDAAPTTRAQLSQSYKAINFPPYAGYDGAVFLNSTGGQGSQTALYVDLDVTKLDKPWYPTISSAAFAALGVLDQNQFCPASLVVASDGGPVAATPAGDVFIKYTVEFIEPINPTMNV
jgi:hypothetical protein